MAKNAAAGRKAQHPSLKLLNGRSEGTDSAGRKVDPPVEFARKLPVKPELLSPDAAWLWDQVVEQMRTVGVLKPLDAAGLEVACETFARWREAVRMRQAVPKPVEDWKGDPDLTPMTPGGLLASNSQGRVSAPWIGIEERASRDFRTWCAEFGFTPAAEKNLTSDPASTGGMPGGGTNPFA